MSFQGKGKDTMLCRRGILTTTLVVGHLLLANHHTAGAGEKHTVIPATRGNTLTLELTNRMDHPLENVEVVISSKPEWVTITGDAPALPLVLPDSTGEVTLMFDIASELTAGTQDSIAVQLVAGERTVAYRTISFQVAVPQEYSLSQNYPNPFNPITHIRYELPEESRVRLVVYDILGRQVVRLVDEQKASGYLEARWDGATSGGSMASSGVYFYRLEATGVSGRRAVFLRKMLLLR